MREGERKRKERKKRESNNLNHAGNSYTASFKEHVPQGVHGTENGSQLFS